MSRTALELSPYEWHAYDPASAIKHRTAEERLSLAVRRREALKVARRIARLLRTEYGAQRVMLFGSLTRRGGFTRWSDIDLAAWGIPADRFFAAVAATTGYSSLFRIDLVDADECRHSLLAVIQAEGKEL